MATLALTGFEARAIGIAIAVPVVLLALVGFLCWASRSSRVRTPETPQTPPREQSDNPFGE
jgi:hypothetical protein